MYAIALVRYRRPLDEVIAHQEPHRAYLRELKAAGTLLAAGPQDPRYGGIFLLKVPDGDPQAALDAVRDNDPFYQQHVAQYQKPHLLERRDRPGGSRPHHRALAGGRSGAGTRSGHIVARGATPTSTTGC